MTEMTEAWATKTKGILVETVNMQKNEAAQEAKGTFWYFRIKGTPISSFWFSGLWFLG